VNLFQLLKTYDMIVLMLDSRLKDLSLIGDYVKHASTNKIATTYDVNFLLPTFKTTVYQKLHECPSSTSVLQDPMRNTNGVFQEGASKEEICFEQASISLFISLDLFVS
jgi:uncharacterized protein YqgQ